MRLEVTTAGEKELLTWPGGARFEDWAVTSFVKSGLVAGGMFASYARNLFLSEAATFQYIGPEELEGRRTVRYDFKGSRLSSLYSLRTGNGAATVATKGSFWFDASSLELVRLDQFAQEIPAELGLTGALTRIRYGRTPNVAPDVLLPQSAEVQLRHSSGEVRRNKTEFTQCREYRAESSISFASPESTAEASHAAPAHVDLPAGLKIKMEPRKRLRFGDSRDRRSGEGAGGRECSPGRRTDSSQGRDRYGAHAQYGASSAGGRLSGRYRIDGRAMGKQARGVSCRSAGGQKRRPNQSNA